MEEPGLAQPLWDAALAQPACTVLIPRHRDPSRQMGLKGGFSITVVDGRMRKEYQHN